MNKTVVLKTRRLILRTLRVVDISQKYVDGLNDSQVNEFLVAPRQRRQTKPIVKEFVQGNLRSPSAILFGLFDKTNGRLIGTLRIHDISDFHYWCHLGICVFDKTYWGQGLAQEALKAAAAFVFEDLKLHYIEAGITQGNTASVKLFEKCGFKRVATFKDKYRYDVAFRPVFIYAKVNPRFDRKLLEAGLK